MYSFTYRKANSLDEALSILAAAADGQLMAGGQTLIPTMKQRLTQPSDLIDLSGIPELAGITLSGDTLVIGAMTTHAAVADSAEIKSAIPALAALAEDIGDPQVRNCGTIGGSVANADPAADYPAAVVGLGATLETNLRNIAADDFFTGLFETALEDDEIITAIHFPKPERAAYMKFPNPASRYALVGVMVAMTGGSPRVAVTGAGASVFRVEAMEQALSSNFDPEAIREIRVASDDLNSDIHATSAYRAHLVTVMATRAVAAAAA